MKAKSFLKLALIIIFTNQLVSSVIDLHEVHYIYGLEKTNKYNLEIHPGESVDFNINWNEDLNLYACREKSIPSSNSLSKLNTYSYLLNESAVSGDTFSINFKMTCMLRKDAKSLGHKQLHTKNVFYKTIKVNISTKRNDNLKSDI